jgi:hypothetical protein
MSEVARFLAFTGCVILAAGDAVAESQEPATADKAKTQHIAVSPNGYSVELVAIVRMDQKERFAWSPDGSKIDISEKWGRLTETGDETHGFVFRCQEFEDGQNLGWKWTHLVGTPILKDEVPEFVSVSTNTNQRLPTNPHWAMIKAGKPLKSNDGFTTICVGVLGEWGPWRRVQSDGTPHDEKPVPKEFQPLYQLVKSVEIKHGNPEGAGRLKCSFLLNGVVGNKQANDLVEYEAVVVDGAGKRHNSNGVGAWLGGEISGQKPYFGLTEDEIAHFEYRIRPYVEWMTFENIPLEPGKDSKLKITVEKVDPPKENAKAN